MPAFGEQPEPARRCRRCRVTSGAWVRAARLREPRRDDAASGGRARRRLLLSGRERRRAAWPKSQRHRHHTGARRTASTRPERVGGRGPSHLKRANALAGDGDCAAAIEEYTKAYELLGDPVVLFNRGECYRRTGDSENAVDDYREFLEKVPNAPNRADIEAKIVALEAPEPAARTSAADAKAPPPLKPAATPAPRAAEPRRPPPPAAARAQPEVKPEPAIAIQRAPPRRPRTPDPAGGSRPGSGSRWRSWSSARPSAATCCCARGRAAAGHRPRQLQVLSVRRAPTCDFRPWSRPPLAPARGLRARRFHPAGRGGGRSDADAGAAVGGRDGGRESTHGPFRSRPRRP